MVLSRASSMRSALRRSTLRSAGPRVRSRLNQQIGRRTYASEHGSHKASSDLPWLIGSIAVTVPSAAWLWSQGPKTGEGHGHGGHNEHAEGKDHKESGEEESKNEGEDKGEAEGKEKPKEDGDEDEGGDDKTKGESEDSGSDDGDAKETPPTSDDEGEDKPGPNAPQQINKPLGGKGPGETSKGERAPTEKKEEKDAQGDHSGAKHPYIDDHEKSKKGEGVTETAKIHGTVDTAREAR